MSRLGDEFVFAIDPGTTESAFAWLEFGKGEQPRVDQYGKVPNHDLLSIVRKVSARYPALQFAVEMVACYGKPVGAEVFETCLWIGRFIEAIGDEERVHKITRVQVKVHLCHSSSKVSDAVIRQAVMDRYGSSRALAIGTKSAPGPLYGVTGDVWSALAVGISFQERRSAIPKATSFR